MIELKASLESRRRGARHAVHMTAMIQMMLFVALLRIPIRVFSESIFSCAGHPSWPGCLVFLGQY